MVETPVACGHGIRGRVPFGPGLLAIISFFHEPSIVSM